MDSSSQRQTKEVTSSMLMVASLVVIGILASAFQKADALATPAPLRLKQLLQSEMDGTRKSDKPILLPCCYDGLTARLVARAGFEATFMTGFGVSGVSSFNQKCSEDHTSYEFQSKSNLTHFFRSSLFTLGVNGYPDTQLVSYAEMQSAANTVAEGLSSAALELGKEPIPCIADGDTGYG